MTVFWKQYATINDDHVIAPAPTPYWFQGAIQRTALAVEHPAAAELLAHASKPCGVVPITETTILIFPGEKTQSSLALTDGSRSAYASGFTWYSFCPI